MPADNSIPMHRRDLVFFDLETSGLDSREHEIIELAAVRVRPDLSRVVSFVNRRCRMDHPERAQKQALEINGYAPALWRDAAPVRVALIEMASIVDADVVLVGHNAARFDWPFLVAGWEREGLSAPEIKYCIDTASIAWPLVVRGHLDRINLEAICGRYGVSNYGQHRAMSDVKRCLAVYQRMLGLPEQMPEGMP